MKNLIRIWAIPAVLTHGHACIYSKGVEFYSYRTLGRLGRTWHQEPLAGLEVTLATGWEEQWPSCTFVL